MKKRRLLVWVLALGLNAMYPAQEFYRAPNSYVFDVNMPLATKGLFIPVAKAYDVWATQPYLFENGQSVNLPQGTESVSVYWQDTPGLVRNLSLEGNGRNGKIKVEIDRAKGKGNAVIAYKINDKIYWSWHVWVTDQPENSSFQNTQTDLAYKNRDINGEIKDLVFMDRNLGAQNPNFIGNGWNKSEGLLYQYGRKDPFPGLINKDLSYYEVEGEVGIKRHVYFANKPGYSTSIVGYTRPLSGEGDINVNLKKTIENPLLPILAPYKNNGIAVVPWYSDQQFAEGGNTPEPNDDVTHDLWADNTEGRNYYSNAAPEYNATRMKLKSPYDPCPNGWRVPSFVSQRTNYVAVSPMGRTNVPSGDTDVIDNFNPNEVSFKADEIKFYPGLGVDFRNSEGRRLGTFSLNGRYTYAKSNNQATAFYYSDKQAEVNLNSATLTAGGEPRAFVAISDIGRFDKNGGLGAFDFYSHAYGGQGANAVRCVQDFNYQLTNVNGTTIGDYDFPTEYFTDPSVVDFKKGLNLPNSYVISDDKTEFEFPILKALSVYNQYLTDHQMISGSLRANILWMSEQNLIKNIKLNTSCDDLERAYIELQLTGGVHGNALVSIENADTGEVYWSWHLWFPDGNPLDDASAFVYTTEQEREMVNTTGLTYSGAPPLTTEFMDRNLGAIYAFPEQTISGSNNPEWIDKAKKSIGMHYQWGRKDPIPSMKYAGNSGSYVLYHPEIDFDQNSPNYGNIKGWEQPQTDVKNIEGQAATIGGQNLSKAKKIEKMLQFAAQNPTSLLVENASNDWLSSIDGLYNERWGHGNTKSVFDPCPDGWRVPDFSFLNHTSLRHNTAITGQDTEVRGTSPWYFANQGKPDLFNYKNKINSTYVGNILEEIKTSFRGVPQSMPYNVETIYGGKKIVRTGSQLWGWNFSNVTNGYRIGNYPVTDVLNKSNNFILNNTANLSALWSAAPEEFQRGEAKAIVFYNNYLYTGTILDFTEDKSQSFKPQMAMNIRCVKHLDSYRGDNGVIEVPPIKCNTTLGNAEIKPMKDIEIYPNPVDEVLYLKSIQRMEYELYDVSGKLIQTGAVKNQQINTGNLLKGMYVLKITNDKNEQMVKKVIKK